MNDESPLLATMRACTPEEKIQLAELAGTTENYLYSIAGSHREPLVSLAVKIEAASRQMNAANPRIPVCTAEQLAAMWAGKRK